MRTGFLKAALLLPSLAGIGGLAWAGAPNPAPTGGIPPRAASPTILPAGLRPALYHLLAENANPGSGYGINKAGCAKLSRQSLKACFKPTGASFSGANGHSLALRLDAYGRGNRLESVAPVRPSIARNQVRYHHGSITEWWRVLPVGFEQGFTLNRRPAGKGTLKFVLASNRPLQHKGRTLSWGKLRYGKLVVTDATGQVIPSRLESDDHGILISVNDADAAYPLTVDPLVWMEQEVAVDDSAVGNMLGYGVAIDGDTAIISTAYAKVTGNAQQGAAYVFVKKDGTWTQVQKLTASDGGANDHFGLDVALDGSTAVIGTGAETAYVFTRSDGNWTQAQELTASDSAANDYFATSVALSGQTILVSAYGANINGNDSQGAVYVFTRSGNTWAQTAKLTANDGKAGDFFGHSIALDDSTALIGADGPSPGKAYVFTHANDSWTQAAELSPRGVTSRDFFGESVALDGSTAIIGAPFTTVQGTGGAGAAYVFKKLGDVWTQTDKLTSSNPRLYGSFGAAVAIEGNTAVVGADDVILYNGPGIAYVFKKSGGSWTQVKKFLPADNSNGDLFGYAIAIDRSTILIGAPHAAIDGNVYQGSAYFYAQPNLALAINAPERVNLDSRFTTTTFATNNSSATSPAVAVSIAVPAAASFVSAAASQGNCAETAGVVRCQFGAIAGNAGVAKADVTLEALGKRGGTITSQAEMLHAQPALSARAATVVNRPPVARGARVNSDRGQTVSGTLKASDADGDPLVFSIVTQPKHGSVKLLDADKGVYTYTPDSGYAGADQFSFKANDGYADSNVASVIIYMANQPPVASDGTLTTDKNAKAQGTLKAKDADGDSLVYRLVTPPAHGTIKLDSHAGNYTYTPTTDYFGTDRFTFKANDGQSDSNVATISITVEGSAPPPPPPSNNSSGGGGFGGLLLALLAGLAATASLVRRLKRNQKISLIRTIHENTQKEAVMRLFKPRTMIFALVFAGVMAMALTPPLAMAHDSAASHQSGVTRHTLANARKAGTPSHLVKMAPQSSAKLLSRATRLGPHSPDSTIKLTVALKLRHVSKLKSFLDQVQNPSSAVYHQWLTPAEFTRLYGPSQTDVARVVAYLKAHDIRVLNVSPNRILIHTEAPTGVYEHAFGIRINDYKLNGRRFYSSADSPILPRALASTVLSVMGLNRGALMRPMHHKRVMQPNAKTAWAQQARPAPDPSVYLSQDQFAKAYDWPSVTDPNHGAGVTIAVLSFASANLLASDYQTYWDAMGVPGHQVTIDDDIDGTPATGAEGETTLDIEYSGYMAPGADIILYEGSQAYNYAFADVFNKLVTDNIAAVASISWGGCDSTWPSDSLNTIEQIIQQAVAQGISISAAAGDSGAAAPRVCDSGSSNALYPASSPYVLDANGTNLTVTDNSGTYGSETAWTGTGGGDSHAFNQPDWQTGPGVPDSGDRMTGDMAMHAGGKGLLFYYQGAWTAGSVGTSFVSPEFAGLFAVANSMNSARLGQSNTLVYGDVNGGHYATDFRDVTTGSNGHPAGPNWDYPTGWGSPDAENLLSHIGIQGPKGTLDGKVTDAASGAPIAGAKIFVTASDGRHFATRSAADGSYSRVLPTGDFTVTVSSFGYADGTASVSITDGEKTNQNFALNAAPQATLSGTVSDGSGHGYGLYANLKISTEGFGQVADVWTDPKTGQYSVNLPKGNSYTLKVAAVFNGYDTASDTVTLSGNKTRDFPLDITATCTAPGYRFESGGLHADFNGADFPPPGWTVKTPQGDINWIPNSQQPFWNGNYTGGTGGAANADSYSTTDAYDTSLVTPPVAVTSLDGATVLRYKANYQPFSDTEALDLDITTDGGQTWTTINHWDSPHGAFADTPGVAVQIDLAQYLPATGDFQLRWRYYNPVNGRSLSDYYAEIDDVVIGACTVLDGGLITGRVTDSNTGEGIIGVRVQDEGSNVTRTLVNPDDPNFPAGSYLFFVQTGEQALTASKPPFSPATVEVTAKKDAVTSQDFVLKSARIEANPQTLTVHVQANGSGTASFALKNTGSGAGQFKVTAIAAPPASTTPLQDYNVPLMHGTPVPDPAWMSASLSWIRAHAKSGNFRMKSASDASSGKGAWQAIADYPHAVGDNFSARDDTTGKVYVLGGVIGGQLTASGFVYDPKADGWAPIANAPIARNAAGIGFIDGKLYVAGGWNLRGQPATELDIYDPASDTWSTGMPDPAGQGGGVAHAVLNGQLYLVGGCNNDACDSPLSAVETYDPVRNSWIALPDYPQTVAFAACGTIQGKLYCAGGLSGSAVNAGGYVYNPASKQWSPIAEMPYPAGAAMYTAANGRLLVAGGFDVSGATTNRVQAYDPATNSWNADMPRLGIAVARGASACGFYQIGGVTAITPFGTTFTAGSERLPGYSQCGIPEIPWLTIAPAQGTMDAGATKRVTLVFDGSEQKEFTTTQAQLMVTGYTPYPTPIIPITVTWDPQPVNLVLSGEVAPTKVGKGNELIYTLTVYNRQAHDHGAAKAVTLSYALPNGISYETASGEANSCTANDGTVTCDFGTIALGNSKTETLAVMAANAGKLTSNFNVSAREPESNDDDNQLSLTSVVIGTADLSLGADSTSIPASGTGPLTLTLKNAGPDPASEVQIHATVGSGAVSLRSATASQGGCTTAGGVLACKLGQVNAGKSVTVTLQLFGAYAGNATVNAQASTASNEPDTANNGVTAKVTVKAPPPPDNGGAGGGGAFGGLALALLACLASGGTYARKRLPRLIGVGKV